MGLVQPNDGEFAAEKWTMCGDAGRSLDYGMRKGTTRSSLCSTFISSMAFETTSTADLICVRVVAHTHTENQIKEENNYCKNMLNIMLRFFFGNVQIQY